jgi:hypothetical protein
MAPEGQPTQLIWCKLVGTYTAADQTVWQLAMLTKHTADRPGFAFTLAEARAVEELRTLARDHGAISCSWPGGPDELPWHMFKPVVGHSHWFPFSGTEVARFLLVKQSGEHYAREHSLLPAIPVTTTDNQAGSGLHTPDDSRAARASRADNVTDA